MNKPKAEKDVIDYLTDVLGEKRSWETSDH